jgi:ZIP family zinc transporter
MHQILLVGLYGLITALATGLGALPFAFVRRISGRAVAVSNALAAGLMLGASFGLLAEGSRHGSLQTIVGANAGLLFVLFAHRWLGHEEVSFGEVTGAGARRMLLIVLVMTVHSFSEGVAVGAAFGGGTELAFLITVAIAVHNIPEGLAISAVLRPEGTSVAACAGWSVFSSLPQPLMAVPAFLLVETVRPALPYGIGFAAGAMVFMVFLELLPGAFEDAPRWVIGLLTSSSMALMLLFQRIL